MSTENTRRPMTILMIDDNPDDVDLLRHALKECQGGHQLLVAVDGIEALAFLRREGQFATVPRPDLVLLDLNMPRKDGREVLAEVKADEDLKTIPIIIFTSSNMPTDVMTVYRSQANCYIQKPLDFDKFLRVTKLIEDFWFGIAELPIYPSSGPKKEAP